MSELVLATCVVIGAAMVTIAIMHLAYSVQSCAAALGQKLDDLSRLYTRQHCDPRALSPVEAHRSGNQVPSRFR